MIKYLLEYCLSLTLIVFGNTWLHRVRTRVPLNQFKPDKTHQRWLMVLIKRCTSHNFGQISSVSFDISSFNLCSSQSLNFFYKGKKILGLARSCIHHVSFIRQCKVSLNWPKCHMSTIKQFDIFKFPQDFWVQENFLNWSTIKRTILIQFFSNYSWIEER